MSTFKMIKRHFKRNRAIFCILIACQICAVFAFCFLFLYFDSIQAYNMMEPRLIVSFSSGEPPEETLARVDELCAAMPDAIDRAWIRSSYNGASVKAHCLYHEVDDVFLRAGRFFEPDDGHTLPQCITCSPKIGEAASYPVGSTVEMFGEPHEVIGISFGDDWEVDRESIPLLPQADGVEVRFAEGVSHLAQKECQIEAERLFSSGKVELVRDTSGTWGEVGILELILFVIILLIIFVNFAALFLYILKEDRTPFRVFRLLGCTLQNAVRISMKEILLVSFGSLAFGILLFQTLVARGISLLNPDFLPQLYWKSVGLIAVCYLIGVVLLFLPLVWVQFRRHVFLPRKGET